MTASRIPDIKAFEERAAIAEYDGRLTSLQAENPTAIERRFASAGAYCGQPPATLPDTSCDGTVSVPRVSLGCGVSGLNACV